MNDELIPVGFNSDLEKDILHDVYLERAAMSHRMLYYVALGKARGHALSLLLYLAVPLLLSVGPLWITMAAGFLVAMPIAGATMAFGQQFRTAMFHHRTATIAITNKRIIDI